MRRIDPNPSRARFEMPERRWPIFRDKQTLGGYYERLAGRAPTPVACVKCADSPCFLSKPDDEHSERLCPVDAIVPPIDGAEALVTSACIGCGICVFSCPVGAISLSGEKISVLGHNPEVLTKLVSAVEQRAWRLGSATSLAGLESRQIKVLVQRFVRDASKLESAQLYPLIASLFRFMGFEATASSRGVNNDRVDVLLTVNNTQVPIEVKSALEVKAINAKSIQQALENKLMLLARNEDKPSDLSASTLIVGFEKPPERINLHRVIDAIAGVYGVNVALLTVHRLYELVLQHAAGQHMDGTVFTRTRGLI